MFRIEHEKTSNTDFPWIIRRDEQFMTSFEDEQTAMSKLIELKENEYRYLDCNATTYPSPLDLIDQAIANRGGNSLSIQHCRDGRAHFRGSVDDCSFMYLILDQSVILQIKRRIPGIPEFSPSRRFDD